MRLWHAVLRNKKQTNLIYKHEGSAQARCSPFRGDIQLVESARFLMGWVDRKLNRRAHLKQLKAKLEV